MLNAILSKYEMDTANMISNFTVFKLKLAGLADVSLNDKIYFDNNDHIVVDKYDSIQFIRRWAFGINRVNTLTKLRELFDEYSKLTDMILFSMSTKHIKLANMHLFDMVRKFSAKIYDGILNLLQTYDDDEDAKSILLSIKEQLRILL
jgi:hypothetical protein